MRRVILFFYGLHRWVHVVWQNSCMFRGFSLLFVWCSFPLFLSFEKSEVFFSFFISVTREKFSLCPKPFSLTVSATAF